MKYIFTLIMLFLLSACSNDYLIDLNLVNNSQEEISGKLYVANEVLLDDILILSNSSKKIDVSFGDIKSLIKKQNFSVGNLKIITNDNKVFEICGYIENDVCGQQSFSMTINKDLSYEIDSK